MGIQVCLFFIVAGLLVLGLAVIDLAVVVGTFMTGCIPLILIFVAMTSFIIRYFAFGKDDKKTKFIFSLVLVSIYELIYVSLVGDLVESGSDLDGLSALLAMPFSLVIPYYYIGKIVGKKVNEYRKNKNEARKRKLLSDMRSLRADNKNIDIKISKYKRELEVLDLIERCGGDISALHTLMEQNEVADIIKLEEKIKNNEIEIKKMEEQLNET